MEKKMILIDTDVLIKIFRGNKEYRKEIVHLAGRISISVITAYELYEGCNSNSKVKELESQVNSYSVILVDHAICKNAIQLYQLYKPSHNLGVADALIAATALHENIELWTDNKKHYQFIKGLKFYHTK